MNIMSILGYANSPSIEHLDEAKMFAIICQTGNLLPK